MTEIVDRTGGGDVDLDAAEYVLGTLDTTERAAFVERMRADTLVRQAVARWDQRFAELAGRLDPVTPPPRIWDAIERALRTEHLKVIEGGRVGVPDVLPNLRASRNRWRLAALASAGVAAALAVVVVGSRLGLFQSTGDTYIAAINRGGDKPALIVSVDLKTHQVVVRPVAAETPPGRSLELWYIGPGQAPRSMGLVEKASETLSVPNDAKGSASFAVSVEPPGGSKTGGPTGPVVYSGQLVKE